MNEEESDGESINILIVAKQPIFRQGLRQVLSSYEDIEVVGECDPDAETWSLVEQIEPDIVLVDVGSPLVNGFAVVRQIVTHCPRVAVVVIDCKKIAGTAIHWLYNLLSTSVRFRFLRENCD